jgi:hypothetical protein
MPFDLGSFFTPRFPSRNRRDDILLPNPSGDNRQRLGPELPPNFYDDDWQADVNIDNLGIDPLRQEEVAGIPKYSIDLPKRPKHPSVAQSLARPLELATTPLLPEEEEKLISKAKEYGGDFLGGLAEFQVGGSTSPLGLIGDYLPIAGPAAVKGATALAAKYGGAKLGAEALGAGIPFLKLGKKLGLPEISGKPVVWRGDPGITDSASTYKEINPQYFNRRDTLGYMGHAAEDKDYAIRDYMYKRGSPYRPTQVESYGYRRDARPNLTAVTAPSSLNAVDLTKLPEDPVDVEKLVKGLELWRPHKSSFGEADRLNTVQKAKDLAEEIPYLQRIQGPIDKKLKEGIPLTMREQLDLQHIGDKMDDIRIPLNDPEITKKLGFDAIRYTDVNKPSWAFPDVSKMETPWGTKLSQRSMGEFPYEVRSPNSRGNESLGFFKTKTEALQKADKEGQGSKIYLGGDKLFTTNPKSNFGYEDYVKTDKDIQNELIPYAEKWKSVSTQQDKQALKLYKEKYENLNDWQKQDVDDAVQKAYEIPDDEFEFDDLGIDKEGFEAATKWSVPKPVITPDMQDEIKFKISKADYANHYDALGKEAKKNVDDIYEDLITLTDPDDIKLAKQNNPEIIDILDEIYPPISSSKVKASIGTAQVPESKVKASLEATKYQTTEFKQKSLAKAWYGKESWLDLTSKQQDEIMKAISDKPKIDMGTAPLKVNDVSTGKTFTVEVSETMDEVLEQLAKQETGKSYNELGPAMKEHIQYFAKLIAHKAIKK